MPHTSVRKIRSFCKSQQNHTAGSRASSYNIYNHQKSSSLGLKRRRRSACPDFTCASAGILEACIHRDIHTQTPMVPKICPQQDCAGTLTPLQAELPSLHSCADCSEKHQAGQVSPSYPLGGPESRSSLSGVTCARASKPVSPRHRCCGLHDRHPEGCIRSPLCVLLGAEPSAGPGSLIRIARRERHHSVSESGCAHERACRHKWLCSDSLTRQSCMPLDQVLSHAEAA